MKKWNTPTINELNIKETEHNWLGDSRDGGYIGDGQISGHLEWESDNTPAGPSESLS